MPTRKIIKIDEGKCDGCGLCIPNCPEGALQVIDAKARLISDLFCDGLGACIGHCPKGAITIEERKAQEYDEKKVMANIVRQGENVIKAHLEHLKAHNEQKYLKDALDFLKEKGIASPLPRSRQGEDKASPCACPGAKIMDFRGDNKPAHKMSFSHEESRLRQWPIQLNLVPAHAPYLNNADLLIAADCVPFAYASFHADLLEGRILLVGCPKFDDLGLYEEKITQILQNNQIKSITYAHMEVPCCFGLVTAIKNAISASGKSTPFKEAVISIKGERLQ